MQIDDFKRRVEFVHGMTIDFVEAVPGDRWEFSPDPALTTAAAADPNRHGVGFAPFCKQVRHVVCVRGVYNAALLTKKVDFSKKHQHYQGAMTREALLRALAEKQRDLLTILETVDTNVSIDFFGNRFTFGDFAFTVIQHEAIHHGQWSIYASLGGFQTPASWRNEWGL